MKPYDLPNLPLKSLNWADLVPFIGDARDELARFDSLLESNIPEVNLLLSPLTVNEAVMSSRIEGTQATLEEVFRFQAEGKATRGKYDDIQEVINYRRAADNALKDLEKLPLTGRLLKKAHKTLLSGVRGEGKNPGNFRDGPVHIGRLGATAKQASYIPPEAQKVPELFTNLEKYIHSSEPDILVQTAIIHAQFELIHPFWDGNGRIGRLLMPLFLYYKKAIKAPCFYISEYLEEHRREYYEGLKNISQKGDWERWIAFFLEAVAEQSRRNAKKASAIIRLKEEILLKTQEVTHSQYTPQITNFIFSHPWFNGVNFRDDADVPRPSAARLLNLLVESGIIENIHPGRGRRSSLFCFSKLVEIIK